MDLMEMGIHQINVDIVVPMKLSHCIEGLPDTPLMFVHLIYISHRPQSHSQNHEGLKLHLQRTRRTRHSCYGTLTVWWLEHIKLCWKEFHPLKIFLPVSPHRKSTQGGVVI